MKKIFSILVICLSLIDSLDAQTSGFAPLGAEWYFQVDYSSVPITQPEFGYMRCRVTDTAEVQGHMCSVIDGYDYVYEENNVVYWYNQGNDAFTVLYDYNAEVGDTWYCDVDECTCLVTVTNVGSVTYNGHTYRTQYVTAFGDDNYPYFDGRIINGIGYEKGLFPDVFACYGGCIDCDYTSYIRCYLENGEMLYHQGSYDCDYIPGITGNCWDGTVAASYAGGDGTSDNPYLISNGKQLALLAQQTNDGTGGDAYYKLTKGIDLQKCSGGLNPWTSIGTPEHPFTGHFDGNGKYLKNLYLCQNTAYKGLFGYTDGANINNLDIFSCMICFESEYAGAFVGYANQTNIINCHVYQGTPDYLNTVYSKYGVAGGIVGTLVNGTVNICSNYANVQTTIQSNGEVSASAGGIVGSLIDGVVSDCFNRGSVSGLYESSGKSILNIGGIVGVSTGNVHNVYNAASVSNASNQHCGEIVGYDTDSLHYLNCYWKLNSNNLPACGNPDLQTLPGSTSFVYDSSTSNWGILNEPQYGTSVLIDALNLGSASNCIWNYENHYPKPYYYEPTYPLLGSEWYYEITNDNGTVTYQYLECAADTTINDQPIHILVRINTLYDKSQIITHEYIYEENNKVYWWNKTLGEFTTLYDFGAEVGDEWEIKVGTQTIPVHVDAAQTVTYKSQEYKMLSISDPDDIFTGDIICGIGHLTSFFPEKLMNKGYRVENIRCFWQDGELIYQNGDQDCDEIYEQHHLGVEEIEDENGFVIYPNPTNDVIFVKTCHSASLQSEYRITNIMGQTLMIGEITSENQMIDVSSLPKGIYFITVNNASKIFVIK